MSTFKPGARVRILKAFDEADAVAAGYPALCFAPAMEREIGREGFILSMIDEGRAYVTVDNGRSWAWLTSCLELAETAGTTEMVHPTLKTAECIICTSTGKRFTPWEPKQEAICIEDIAHALSHMPRFGGHTSAFYSVAQHSVLVSKMCPPELKLAGLLHDAAEAYLLDLPTPIKRMLPDYSVAERRLILAIGEKFGVTAEQFDHDAVKKADAAALEIERNSFMPAMDWWPNDPTRMGDLVAMGSTCAKFEFSKAFNALTGVEPPVPQFKVGDNVRHKRSGMSACVTGLYDDGEHLRLYTSRGYQIRSKSANFEKLP